MNKKLLFVFELLTVLSISFLVFVYSDLIINIANLNNPKNFISLGRVLAYTMLPKLVYFGIAFVGALVLNLVLSIQKYRTIKAVSIVYMIGLAGLASFIAGIVTAQITIGFDGASIRSILPFLECLRIFLIVGAFMFIVQLGVLCKIAIQDIKQTRRH